MFIRYALSTAAVLLLASCAMTPAQPVATTPPSMPPARPAPAVSVAVPMAPAAAASIMAPTTSPAPAAPVVGAATPAVSASSTEPPQARVVVATPKPAPKKHHVQVAKSLHPTVHNMVLPKPGATLPSHAAMVELTGHVTLTGSHGQNVSPTDATQTLVYFVPASGNVPPRPGHYTVFTHDRHFDPRAMAIPLGSTVTFTNLDDFRHSVYSLTPGSTFDLGYQPGGTSDAHAFTHAGLVLISCHVHRSMALNMLVIPTRFVAKLTADGSFMLHVPVGPGTLHIWNPRARPMHLKVNAPAVAPISETLDLNMPAVPTQLYVTGAP